MNNGRIQLQQDGAKSQILEDDEEFKEVVDEIGLNHTVYTQSPNSPDTNILNLHFFRAIQSFNDDCPANEEELIKSVEKAYHEYPLHKLNHVWLTFQSCLNMIIENDGGNDYKIPHMGKRIHGNEEAPSMGFGRHSYSQCMVESYDGRQFRPRFRQFG